MTNESHEVDTLARQAESTVLPVVEQAKWIEIRDDATYVAAGEWLKELKGAQKRVKDIFEPMEKSIRESGKVVRDRKQSALGPIEQAEDHVKGLMMQYRRTQERKAEEDRRKFQAQANEQALKERERLEKRAAKLKTEEKREALLEQAAAVQAHAVTVQAEPPKVAGQSIRKLWKAEVTDHGAAVLALLDFPDAAAYVTINSGELNKLARRTKGAIDVPGVRFYSEDSMASTSR